MNITSELNGKVAIVTGSSRGIGEAIARRLALAGARVVVTARTIEVRDERLPGTINSVRDAINEMGGEAIAIACNMQKKVEREALVEQTLVAFGRVDVLVNNAAILVPGPTIDYSERYFDRMFEILVKAPFHLCQLVLPGMIERGEGGSILNISSSAAKHPKPGQTSYDGAVYGLNKAAIERFTTGLATEMFQHNISVNALSPDGFIATPGQMFGRKYSQELIDRAEPVEGIAEAAMTLVTGNPQKLTAGIRYTSDVTEEFKLNAADIGMDPPVPN